MNRWTRVALVAVPLSLPLLVAVPPLLSPMTLHFWVQLLAAAIVLAALPAAIVFPLMYAQASWWRTLLGWALMLNSVGVCGVVVLGAQRVLRDWPNIERTYSGEPVSIDLFRLTVYLLLIVGIYYSDLALWIVSRRGKDLHSDDAEVRSHSPDSSTASSAD